VRRFGVVSAEKQQLLLYKDAFDKVKRPLFLSSFCVTRAMVVFKLLSCAGILLLTYFSRQTVQSVYSLAAANLEHVEHYKKRDLLIRVREVG
jgi:hypothetical protein